MGTTWELLKMPPVLWVCDLQAYLDWKQKDRPSPPFSLQSEDEHLVERGPSSLSAPCCSRHCTHIKDSVLLNCTVASASPISHPAWKDCSGESAIPPGISWWDTGILIFSSAKLKTIQKTTQLVEWGSSIASLDSWGSVPKDTLGVNLSMCCLYKKENEPASFYCEKLACQCQTQSLAVHLGTCDC